MSSTSEASELPSEEEIDALLARARSYEPYLVGDKEDLDQCNVVAAERTLRLPRGSLPAIAVNAEDRFDRWEGRLAQRGYEIVGLDRELLPPDDRLPWVAVVKISETANHAIAMLGHGLATFDPFEPYRPRRIEDVVDAWRIVETT